MKAFCKHVVNRSDALHKTTTLTVLPQHTLITILRCVSKTTLDVHQNLVLRNGS